MMSSTILLEAVRKMRYWQIKFEKSRHSYDRDNKIKCEKIVDALINEKKPETNNLFQS